MYEKQDVANKTKLDQHFICMARRRFGKVWSAVVVFVLFEDVLLF